MLRAVPPAAVPPVPVLHVQVQEALILKITIRSNLASQADQEGNIFDTQNRTGGILIAERAEGHQKLIHDALRPSLCSFLSDL